MVWSSISHSLITSRVVCSIEPSHADKSQGEVYCGHILPFVGFQSLGSNFAIVLRH